MKKKLLTVLLSAAMVMAVGVPAFAAEETEDTINIVRTADSAYLDPNAESIGGAECIVMQQLYEGLVKSSRSRRFD